MTVLMGTAPDFLDPQEGYTTQSAEATWLSYIGPVHLRAQVGQPGGEVIPGLAQNFPQVSDDGKTYTLTLRTGLKYSDGSPVKASDFAYTIERALKLNWGGKSFFTGYIKGAPAYDAGKAKTISGIKADDATGKITIELTKPYGAFLNVLAFPRPGLVPSGTKKSNLSNDPPPGVGPYEIKNVVPNRSFDVVRNPEWTDTIDPGRCRRVTPTSTSRSLRTRRPRPSRCSTTAPTSSTGRTRSRRRCCRRSTRRPRTATQQNTISTFYFFLNTQAKPFNNQLAREAVNLAVDRRALTAQRRQLRADVLVPAQGPGRSSDRRLPVRRPERRP